MIKKTIGILAIASLIFTTSCKEKDALKLDVNNAQVENANGKVPVMTFEEQEFDFGTIKEGDKVEHIFTFKNTGDADLIIADAKGSCGCTIPEYKKEPIKPGESSSMKVSFDSTGKPGDQHKSVNITANTAAGNEILKIQASVTPKAGGIGVTN